MTFRFYYCMLFSNYPQADVASEIVKYLPHETVVQLSRTNQHLHYTLLHSDNDERVWKATFMSLFFLGTPITCSWFSMVQDYAKNGNCIKHTKLIFQHGNGTHSESLCKCNSKAAKLPSFHLNTREFMPLFKLREASLKAFIPSKFALKVSAIVPQRLLPGVISLALASRMKNMTWPMSIKDGQRKMAESEFMKVNRYFHMRKLTFKMAKFLVLVPPVLFRNGRKGSIHLFCDW